MPKQKGFLKVEGTMGDITFVKTQDGYKIKEKSGVNANRIKNDPAFQRTRENGAEFGRAGKAGKVLRNALRSLLQSVSDRRMVSRLTQSMMAVLKADTTSIRGERTVTNGEPLLLKGFEFNVDAPLNTTFYAPYSYQIDRVTGDAEVSIPPFVPGVMILIPAGATHYKIRAAATEVDFENEVFTTQVAETAFLPWDNTETAAINLVNTLPANSVHPLFLALSIEFSQEVNGRHYALNNGTFTAMSIVEVNVA